MPNIYQFFGGSHFAITWAEIRALQFYKRSKLEDCDKHLKICSFFDKFFWDYVIANTLLVYSNLSKEKVLDMFNFMGGSLKVASYAAQNKSLSKLIHDSLGGIVKSNLAGNHDINKHGSNEHSDDITKIKIRLNFYNFSKNDFETAINIIREQKKAYKQKNILIKFVGDINMPFVNTASSKKYLQKQIPEFNITFDDSKKLYVLTRTLGVQNFDLFETLEFNRPERDMKIGMMPIKLAFIMLNLANLKKNDGFWDPMCGVGTLIMAGILKKLYSYGSDVNFIALAKAKHNIDWLLKTGLTNSAKFRIFKFDIFRNPKNNKILRDIIRFGRFDAIVTEGYLGKPRKKPFVNKRQLNMQLREIEKLYSAFLKTVSRLIFPGKRVVFTVPIYKTIFNNKVSWVMPNIDINKHRYKIVKYNTGDLVWRNKKSNVARKLFILEKIK